MGILSWWTGNKAAVPPAPELTTQKPESPAEIPEMNGAVEVTRPAIAADITVFEFGSVAATADKVTLAGYCPVSEEMEPCRWEILPATDSNAPQFRVVF